MPARRFGNVRQLPSGRYQARYVAPDGQERLAPHTFAESEAARLWLSEQEVGRARGGNVDPRRGKVTLKVYADEWIDERVDLSPRTEVFYRSLLDLHILPKLGYVELGTLDLETVRKWRAGLLRAGLGPITVAKSYRLLRTVLNTAVEDKRISANPCQIKKAGVENSPERRIATMAEVFTLADAIEPRFRSLVLLASFGGLRFGELSGLARKMIDLDAGTVSVEVAATEVRGNRLVKEPKSTAGKRRVSLPPQIVAELRKHLDTYVAPEPSALVFCGPRGGPIMRGNFHVVWAAARTAAGVPDTFHLHDLRHTGNTLAAATGASTADLMARMGHDSARAALIYQHATRDADQAIAAALGETISKAEAKAAKASRHAPGTKLRLVEAN